MTKEAILEKHGRMISGPSLQAMEEYAKQQCIAFDKWKYENRWFLFDGQYWQYTFEQGSVVGEKTYNKHYRKTTEQLYELFITQTESK